MKKILAVVSKVVVPLLCVLIGAALLLVTATLRYEQAFAWLSGYSSDGKLEILTPAFYASIISKIQLVGIALLVLGGLLFWFRQVFSDAVWRLFSALADIGRSVRGIARRFWQTESAGHLLVLGIILAAGIVIRLRYLNSAPMRADESYTYVYFSAKPLVIGLSNYIVPNNHLLHTMLVHFTTQLFGNAPWAIRLPAFLFGVLLIPATYWLGRILTTRPAATLGAALVAVGFPLIQYAVNGRGYSLEHVLSLMLFAVIYKMRTRPRLAVYLALVIITVAGLWNIPVFLTPLCIAAIWHLLWVLRQPAAERWPLLRPGLAIAVVSAILTVLLYSPVLVATGLEAIVANEFIKPVTYAEFLALLPGETILLGTVLVKGLPTVVLALLGIGLVAALVLARRRAPDLIALALIGVGWTIVFTFLMHKIPPPRVHFFLLPVLYLTAATGWDEFVRRLLGERASFWPTVASAAAVGAVLVVATYLLVRFDRQRFTPTQETRDAETVANYLNQNLRPDDRLILSSNSTPILSYYLLRLRHENIAAQASDFPVAQANRMLMVYYAERGIPYKTQFFKSKADSTGFRPRRLVKRFVGSELYEYTRIVPVGAGPVGGGK